MLGLGLLSGDDVFLSDKRGFVDAPAQAACLKHCILFNFRGFAEIICAVSVINILISCFPPHSSPQKKHTDQQRVWQVVSGTFQEAARPDGCHLPK